MPVYTYRALNAAGKTVRGVVDADTPQKARHKLRSDGLHPVEISPAARLQKPVRSLDSFRKALSFKRRPLRPLTIMTRQAATLLSAGLPLVSALAAIEEQTDDQEFRRTLALIRDEVTSGQSLADALARHPDVFPPDYFHLVRAGELSGSLDLVLERLADHLERRLARRAKVSAALAYPVFMTLVGGMVLFFLLSFIIPTLTGLFANLQAALPWPTRLLLALSGFLQSCWWLILLILFGLILLFRRYLQHGPFYRRIEAVLFRIPRIGSLLQRLLLAQALRSLAVMSAGGVALTTALTVTARGLGRSGYGLALEQAAEMVGQGRSLAEGLGASPLFPPLTRRMVAVGEASGTLTQMLQRVAQTYEEETDHILSALTSLVEPIIILTMGLIIGFIVISVLLPIFNLSGLVG